MPEIIDFNKIKADKKQEKRDIIVSVEKDEVRVDFTTDDLLATLLLFERWLMTSERSYEAIRHLGSDIMVSLAKNSLDHYQRQVDLVRGEIIRRGEEP